MEADACTPGRQEARRAAAFVGTALGGRYRLEEVVGRGGMSTVYRAFDGVLERTVAIKLMHRQHASDADQLERFRREARAMARLIHPHIVTRDRRRRGGAGRRVGERRRARRAAPYIVFEYVEGETLKQRIRREGPLEIQQAIAYAIEIGRGLQAAHEHGIVHRDIKPQNVLLSGEGGAKITDFGIARTLSEEGLTMNGRVLGDDRLRLARAGARAEGHGAVRHLLARRRALRDAHRLGSIHRGHAGRGGDASCARAAARRAGAAPRASPRHSARWWNARRRRTSHGAIPTPRRWCVTSRRCSRSRRAARVSPPGEVTMVVRSLPRAEPAPRPMAASAPSAAGSRRSCWRRADRRRARLRARTHASRRGRRGRVRRRTCSAIHLAQTAAHDYNPFGTGPEHPDEVSNAIDGDPNTTWSTEHYLDGTLGKPGVGLYVDAAPGVAARAIAIHTPTPGFLAAIYAAQQLRRRASPTATRTPLASAAGRCWRGAQPIARQTVIRLDTAAARYRYYLVWITRLQPDSAGRGRRGADLRSHASQVARGLATPALVALERVRGRAGRRAPNSDPGVLDELGVDARRREAGHRV